MSVHDFVVLIELRIIAHAKSAVEAQLDDDLLLREARVLGAEDELLLDAVQPEHVVVVHVALDGPAEDFVQIEPRRRVVAIFAPSLGGASPPRLGTFSISPWE